MNAPNTALERLTTIRAASLHSRAAICSDVAQSLAVDRLRMSKRLPTILAVALVAVSCSRGVSRVQTRLLLESSP